MAVCSCSSSRAPWALRKRLPSGPGRRVTTCALRYSAATRVRPARSSCVVQETWLGGTRVSVLEDGTLVYAFAERSTRSTTQERSSVSNLAHLVGTGEDASLLSRIATAQGWRVSNAATCDDSPPPPGAVTVVCSGAEALIKQAAASSQQSPAAFASHLTARTSILAVVGSGGAACAGAMLAHALRSFGEDVTWAPRFCSDAVPRPASRAPPRRLVLELGPAEAECALLEGLNPALLLALRVPPADVRRWARFAARLRPGGALIVCGDDEGAATLAAAASERSLRGARDPLGAPRALITFGTGMHNDWRATRVLLGEQSFSFDVMIRRSASSVAAARFTLPLPHQQCFATPDAQLRAALGALVAAALLDASAAHASEGGGMDCVAAAADGQALVRAAAAVAEAMRAWA